MKTYNNYPIINNVIFFYKGEFSQWAGALSDGKTYPFKISIYQWSSFFKDWLDYDAFLTEFDTDDSCSTWDGFTHHFTTAEHAMMFGKAVVFGDFETAKKILETTHPKDVKQLGREVKNYDQQWWDQVKLPLVTMINYHKFSQNENLRELLKNTGQYIICEHSPYDAVWGIAMTQDDPDIGDISKWKGQNLLGQALMRVRDML